MGRRIWFLGLPLYAIKTVWLSTKSIIRLTKKWEDKVHTWVKKVVSGNRTEDIQILELGNKVFKSDMINMSKELKKRMSEE